MQVRSGHRQHVYVAVFVTLVADQLVDQSCLLQRLLGLGLFVARCALVRNSLQTSCL